MKIYGIGAVAERMGLSVATIRYYDEMGLLPFVKRDQAGRRRFTDDNIQLLQMILDLKHAGVAIKDIAHFVSWRLDGDDSLHERYQFLAKHEQTLEDEISQLESSLAYLRFKKWYYRTAEEAGTEKIHLRAGSKQVDPQTYREYQELLQAGHTAQELGNGSKK
ncbi:MerR family transcriptional regulator [Lactiplantibacillus pentosus]|uniref:MerR family transcriptional regulator n=1 Tax=Lactiplantibacillus pentosus TaxID=1589 RepID=UPI003C1DC75D